MGRSGSLFPQAQGTPKPASAPIGQIMASNSGISSVYSHRDDAEQTRIRARFTMNDDRDKREGQTGAHAKNPRADRLKLALRENLKRRKSQARARSHVTMAPSNDDDLPPHDAGGKKPGK